MLGISVADDSASNSVSYTNPLAGRKSIGSDGRKSIGIGNEQASAPPPQANTPGKKMKSR
jgi:hypothetical protein